MGANPPLCGADLLLGGLLLVSGMLPPQSHTVRLTYYLPTGNVMFSGVYPYQGAAACSWGFPIGERLRFPDGMVVTCMDRGLLGGGRGWVDLFAPTHSAGESYVRRYGRYTTVTVVSSAPEPARGDEAPPPGMRDGSDDERLPVHPADAGGGPGADGVDPELDHGPE